VLAVGKCCYVAVCSAAEGASAPSGDERGGAYRGGRPPTACLGFNSGYKITTHKQRFGHVNVTNRTSSEISYIKKTKIRTFDLMFLGLKKTKKI